MRNLVVLASLGLLTLQAPAFAQGQGGGKPGEGGGQAKSERSENAADAPGQRGNGAAGKAAKSTQPASGNSGGQSAGHNTNADQSQGQGPSPRSGQGQAQVAERQRQSNGNVTVQLPGPVTKSANRNGDFRFRTVEAGRYVWRDPGFQGCPPGLAKKGNGCLPPGQARKLTGRDDGVLRWIRYADWYRADRVDEWRYGGGYAYRIDTRSNLVLSVLPLLGGALFGGNSWPQSYTNYQVTPYQDRYYRTDDSFDYRYADGAVFAVDPKTQMIQSIAGLLTGDDWAVGSAVPQGYGFYNVPVQYRDRYADSASSQYRYDDGRVYEIDPTTQLVRRLIELVV